MEDKDEITAKKIQCWIGFLFLIPAILGIIAFVFQIFDADFAFTKLRDLSEEWTTCYSEGGGGMSAAPIYMALSGMTGAYLIKDNLKYLFK